MEVTRTERLRLARMIAAGAVDRPLDPALAAAARSEGVLPILQWMAGDVTPLRAGAALQLARRARLSRVLDLLAARGVSAVVFKGAHLACTCYPDPAVRPCVDTDLLIRPSDVAAARGVFEESGHRLIPHVSGRLVMSQCHYTDGATGGAHVYDVHWQIANPPAFHDLLSHGEILAQATRLPDFGPHGYGPSVPHALVIACVHRAAHHDASERLVWLNDVRLLLRAASHAERQEFCAIASARGLAVVCADACRRAADLFGDVDVPPALLAAGAAPPERLDEYVRAPSGLKRIWLDARALERWRDRATLIREHLFPPADYMRQTFGTPLAWAYTTRIVGGLFARTRKRRPL